MAVVLNGTVAELVENQTAIGNYQSPEDLIYEALDALRRKKIDTGIAKGLADVEAGNYQELTQDNAGDIARSIVANSLK